MERNEPGLPESTLQEIQKIDPITWAKRDASFALSSLKTNPGGLSEAEVQVRQKILGYNEMEQREASILLNVL